MRMAKSEINNSNGKDEKSHLVAIADSNIEPTLLQVGNSAVGNGAGNHAVNGTDLVTLLKQYELLPKLREEMAIDKAIAPFDCTPKEQAECCLDFYKQRQLNTEVLREKWLQEQGMTEAQLINLATRQLRIEKFKEATWGKNLENYFLQRKSELDQYVYSLIRVRDGAFAQELYSRLQTGKETFTELAKQYSEGPEAKTGGLIGPVPLSLSHPKLAQILQTSELGELSVPSAIEDIWVIVRIEKIIPAQFDEEMQQKLLDELFDNWLKEQMKKTARLQLIAS
ncbi:peptidylprolyl isomerase [Aerosakkonemataceae cyanobacterium BLCC-F154]|uniref:peptidylprolyl isomerase n=1 Tax=Floridaenema fluviatile BLCC-F154 TaxID=3153640 RepID=A0ABV4YKG5_9CYAN